MGLPVEFESTPKGSQPFMLPITPKKREWLW